MLNAKMTGSPLVSGSSYLDPYSASCYFALHSRFWEISFSLYGM